MLVLTYNNNKLIYFNSIDNNSLQLCYNFASKITNFIKQPLLDTKILYKFP